MSKKYYAVRTVQVRVYDPEIDDKFLSMDIPDELVDVITPYDAILSPFDAPNFKTAKQVAIDWLFSMSEKMTTEIASLRAQAAEYQHIAELIDPYQAYDRSIYDQIVDLLHDDTSAEIVAAHAPAEQAEQEQGGPIYPTA